MEPNLKSCHATSLQFSTTLPLSSDLLSKLRDTSPPDKDGDSLFVVSYAGHKGLALIIEMDKLPDADAREVRLSFSYKTGTRGRIRKGIAGISQLVSILSSEQGAHQFDCEAFFEFGRRVKPRPIISLPIRYFDLPNMPFDNIQGVHLVKLDGKERKYDVVLDVPSRGAIMENIFFTMSCSIDASLASRILEEATRISGRFVLTER